MTIDGEPFGKPRPRFSRHAYKDARTREQESRVLGAWEAAGRPTFGRAPLRVEIDAWTALPRSRPRRVEAEPYAVRPDADNIAKAVLDALNGRAWDDDAQVVELRVTKHDRGRRTVPHTTVRVSATGLETDGER